MQIKTLDPEGIAPAVALKFQKPVRYIPSLAESLLITSKRHPFDIFIKLGADENGKMTAGANSGPFNQHQRCSFSRCRGDSERGCSHHRAPECIARPWRTSSWLGSLERGAVRFSIGLFNTQERIDRAVEAMTAIAGYFR